MFPDHDIFDAPDFQGTVFKSNRTAVIYHPDYIAHDTGNHPENPQRLIAMKAALEAHPVNSELEWVEPELCVVEDILRCHTREHHDLIKSAASRAENEPGGLVYLDPDTPVCAHTYTAALRAVGGLRMGVDMVLKKHYPNAWCMVRPPGHHATSDRAMGFCMFNNAACAAEYARKVHGLERIMIIDYDLHHGNGTQDIFYNDPGVLYTSIHQSYHYPGTGHINEIGSGEGRGYTVNFPVLASSGDCEMSLYMREIMAPIAEQYKPQLIIVSAGFDAHALDPLGYLQVSTEEYGKIVLLMHAIATDIDCGIVYTLEGGYSIEAQAESIVQSLVAATCEKLDPRELPTPNRPPQSAISAHEELRANLKGIWDI